MGFLFLPRPSRFGGWAFDNTISKMCVLEATKENNKSESISNWKRVRIILVWCSRGDLNPHLRVQTST